MVLGKGKVLGAAWSCLGTDGTQNWSCLQQAELRTAAAWEQMGLSAGAAWEQMELRIRAACNRQNSELELSATDKSGRRTLPGQTNQCENRSVQKSRSERTASHQHVGRHGEMC
ncbi:MAG TPA: hypothetical protein PKC98_03825 [Candidatus Melainabacteria bacterium]|nr:hypothetical protein [Candidatus Melainabacteria bacterium]